MRAYLPLLACSAMMLFCVGPMLFSRRHNQTDTTVTPGSDTEVQQLRQQVRDLQARLDPDRTGSEQGHQ